METLCSLLALYVNLSICHPAPPPAISGYVEGDYVAIAPVGQAAVRRILVAPDQHVSPGQPLAELDTEDTALALDQARAGLAEARAVLANMSKGQRNEQIEALSATLDSWAAEERRISANADRTSALFNKFVASKAEFDNAQAALAIVRSRLEEARANLAIAKLPARPDEVAAQQERVAAAEAQLRLAEWHQAQRTLVAKDSAVVETVIRKPGEIASPAAPVLSLLPDGAVKIKFYVSADERAAFGRGARLALTCGACGSGLAATVTRLSDAPEFTPPVIYSAERSQRLTYLAEARPDAAAFALQPGEIVSVRAVPR